MITVPTSLLPTNSVHEACPGSDESSFNGWRGEVSDMFGYAAKARHMAVSGAARASSAESSDSAKGLRRAVNKTAHGKSGGGDHSGGKHSETDIAAETLQLMASSGGNSTATPSRHVHSQTTP